MKKLYMEPATRVVTAQTTQFLMTSGGVHGGDGYGDIDYAGLGNGDQEVD